MKKYRSHKIVEAGKIAEYSIDENLGYAAVILEGGITIKAPQDIFARLDATKKVGGYLVKYGDGYLSWSPAKAFEDGYTEIE